MTSADKTAASKDSVHRSCDVCIIRCGTAGLYLAQSQRNTSVKVIVVEAGNASIATAQASFPSPILVGDTYKGAFEGRVSGLGGRYLQIIRSLLWRLYMLLRAAC